ncbi:MAG TPA: GNAT family N-acetyltransferase [Actinomycetes bacterium]
MLRTAQQSPEYPRQLLVLAANAVNAPASVRSWLEAKTWRQAHSTCRIVRTMATEPAILVVPANEATWEDLQTVLGTRGTASNCQCQRYKLRPRESFASFPAEERAHRLRQQADCGHPESGTTSGLVAYLDGEPVGWCAVEPRTAYAGLLRTFRVPWEGRAEDKTDDGVWAVTCFVTRAGFRKRGVSRALARAAVDFARRRGARAVEGYPMTTKNVILEELHVGTEGVFADAGFTQVSRPTLRRVVMRVDF